MVDRIGIKLASYRIESLLSRGGMGEVYLAEQDAPRRKVALKLLSPEFSEDAGFRERFVRESEAAASIDHPNVIPIYQAGQADGALFIAMRYVDGTDLRTLLAEHGPLPPERAVRICAQIADALEAAHERGLVHRDVKPANILVGRNDHAYLSDFGLIRRQEVSTGITKTGQFMGTIDYVAPEQIKGEAVDGRADIYSLGCVLYECLTGVPPFRRETEVATLYAHLEDPPPMPSATVRGVSKALDQVVARAMAKRPEERFTTAEHLGTAILGAVRTEVVSTSRRFPEQRRRRGLAVAVVTLIAVIAVAVAAIVSSPDGEESTDSSTSSTAPRLSINSLVHLDAKTGEVLSTTSIPALRNEVPVVEVGEGGVWVLALSSLVHVDPVDGAIVASIPTGVGTGTGAATSFDTGFRTVWVGAPPGVMRIDPGDDQTLRSVRLGEPGAEGQQVAVATGESHAWAVQPSGDLTRIAPFTARKTGTADVAQSASQVEVGFGSVWVVDDLRGTVTSVEPTTLRIRSSIAIAGEVDDIAAGAGAVWILDSDAGVVIPIDPETSSAGSPVRVGEHPTDVATGMGAVWVANPGGGTVANPGDGTISRVDPVTRHVSSIPVGGPVVSLAVDERTATLWVAVALYQTG